MKIAYVYNKRHLNPESVINGLEPSDHSYGLVDLLKNGHQVDLYPIDPEGEGIKPSLSQIVMAYIFNSKTTSIYLAEASRIYKSLYGKDYDGIVVIPLKMAIALGFVAEARIARRIVGIMTGIVNAKDSFLTRFMMHHILNKIKPLVIGEGEKLPMIKNYWLRADHVKVIPYGIDAGFWHSTRGDNDDSQYILAVGNDGYRDYDVLLSAAVKIDYPFRILSKLVSTEKLPANVIVHQTSYGSQKFSYSELRELYSKATIVVTPIKQTYQPSGQSVTMQAMACGCAVVLPNYDGIWCRKQILNNETVILYKTGDAENLKEMICKLLNDKAERVRIAQNARMIVEEYGSARIFARDLAMLIQQDHQDRRENNQ